MERGLHAISVEDERNSSHPKHRSERESAEAEKLCGKQRFGNPFSAAEQDSGKITGVILNERKVPDGRIIQTYWNVIQKSLAKELSTEVQN